MTYSLPTRPPGPDKQIPDLVWLNRISKLMDSRFTIPGTNIRFGLDPLLGLLPVAGDAAGLLVSGMLVAYMARYGASRKLVLLMAGNVLLDAIIGAIPLLGWLFDFYYKANDRNIRLMRQYYSEGKHQGKGTGLLIALAVGFVVLLAGIIYASVKISQYVWDWLSSYF